MYSFSSYLLRAIIWWDAAHHIIGVMKVFESDTWITKNVMNPPLSLVLWKSTISKVSRKNVSHCGEVHVCYFFKQNVPSVKRYYYLKVVLNIIFVFLLLWYFLVGGITLQLTNWIVNSPKRCFSPGLVEISWEVLEKNFKICHFTILSLFPIGESPGPSLNKINSSMFKKAFCQVWLKLAA